jgi:uncharacterized protein DUF2589
MSNGEKKDLAANEYTAMSLYQLLGAPLRALVDAETHAADATARFIAAVGFEQELPPKPGPGEAKPGAPPPAPAGQPAPPPPGAAAAGAAPPPAAPPVSGEPTGPEGARLEEWRHLGKLRMARFHHETPDGALHRIEVPVLSLVPIPALQIKEATVEFAVKVVDTIPLAPRTEDRRPGLTEPPSAIDLKGSIARQRTPGAGLRQAETQMTVKVTMQQADVPSGLARLFHLMDQHVTAERHAPVEVAPAAIAIFRGEKGANVTVTVRDERAEPASGVLLDFEVLDVEQPQSVLGFQTAGGAREIRTDKGKAVVTVTAAANTPAGRLVVNVRDARPERRDLAATFVVDVRAR